MDKWSGKITYIDTPIELHPDHIPPIEFYMDAIDDLIRLAEQAPAFRWITWSISHEVRRQLLRTYARYYYNPSGQDRQEFI